MAYPNTKETFPRREGRDLSQGIEGDLVYDIDNNNPVDFLERLEDSIGYNWKDGFSDLAARLDALVYESKSFFFSLLGKNRF